MEVNEVLDKNIAQGILDGYVHRFALSTTYAPIVRDQARIYMVDDIPKCKAS